MSALPPKADIAERDWHDRFVPKADIVLLDLLVGRATNAGGTDRPSALAVLRLITNSNLVGDCTDMSAGLSPAVSMCKRRALVG